MGEIKALGEVLDAYEASNAESLYAATAYRLLLLTGCRLGEIQTLEWPFVYHVQIAEPGVDIFGAHISTHGARLLIGCDAVVAATPENLARLSPGDGLIVDGEVRSTPTIQFIGITITRLE